ncbi:MAG: FprA family A-type flavoprotein [Bacteroidales bacterium]|nr:FprA family A-type flavoprotein [Bacteroidales bacterium]
MNITKDIFYIGVNERSNKLFESIWPLPNGISYNSYLINDKKNVIVDLCDARFYDSYLINLKEALMGETPDFLVINHMEPDHSGALREILKDYPEITIIGNAKTLSMVEGFYGIHPHVLEVKDKEELSIGSRTLKFFLTPMVHWPETMMSYIIEDKVLFSGDAFGCFGALNGNVTDSDLELSLYFEEMRRYYACIVGKYGVPVKKAVEKLGDTPIEIICTTHGPIWKENVKEVVERYTAYANYQAEDGVTIVYGSMYGNTTVLVEYLAKELASNGVKNINIFDTAATDYSYILSSVFKYNTVVMAAPAYNGILFPAVQNVMNAIHSREVKNRKFASLGNFSWGSAPLSLFDEFAKDMNWDIIAPTIKCKQSLKEADVPLYKELAKAIASNFCK